MGGSDRLSLLTIGRVSPGVRWEGVATMHELTSHFISAFNRIEKRLEAIVAPKDYLPFAQLVEKAAGKNSAVRSSRSGCNPSETFVTCSSTTTSSTKK